LRGLPDAHRYLEIGVEKGYTLENVDVAARWAVDPNPQFDLSRLPRKVTFFRGTSDEFFEQLAPDVSFDVVFLDGLHTFEQTGKDLVHALAHLHHGAVLIDDTVPSDAASATPDRQASLALRAGLGAEMGLWHGDVWKLVVCIARHHPELAYRTVVGSENPQTLVWQKEPGAAIAEPSAAALSEIAALDYSAVFADGLPDSFRPCDEDTALAECLNDISAHRR
jgi:methyltransferase family protein